MRIDWAVKTDTGRVRSQNEDTVRAEGEANLVVLCDGMGGHRAGEVASRIAVDTFFETAGSDESKELVPKLPSTPPETITMIRAAKKANAAVHTQAQSQESYRGMGCTLVALRLLNDKAYFVSVGDSRLYLLRSGRLHLISQDHTRLRMLEQMGYKLDPAETKQLQGMLIRAMGTKPEVDIDHGHGPALSGDKWLLCSDGLTDELSDDQIEVILERAETAETAAAECVRLAVEAGGRDNVSVAVAQVVSGAEVTGSEELPRPETYPPPVQEDHRETETGSGILSRLSRRLRKAGDEEAPDESH